MHMQCVPGPFSKDMEKPESQVFLLMHVVYKSLSTTIKIRAVFDALAKSVSGVLLNNILLVATIMHPPLEDVFLHFQRHQIAITIDISISISISKMYRAVQLFPCDRDLHSVWRSSPSEVLEDYQITSVTFGVSPLFIAANMCIK